jgi:YHS domain-containing protein
MYRYVHDMDEITEGSTSARQRERIVATLDRMVASGRLTQVEADRLRNAAEPGQFDAALRSVRVRHARAKLAMATRDGSLSREDADAILDRLRKGEHSRAIRSHLRSLLPGNRARSRRATAGRSIADGSSVADGNAISAAIDPVCKMSVDPSTSSAIRSYNGVEFLFCSVGCAEMFDAAPERYANTMERKQS